MPDGEPQPTVVVKEEIEKAENEVAEPVNEADVLEEDDDFEDFEHEVTDQQAGEPVDVEWEDNWDDEVEGENEFAKRLRAELEKNKDIAAN